MSPKQEKVFIIDPDRCTGCHSCEMACSIKHFGVCSPRYSRIRIEEFPEINSYVPVVCQACEDPVCIRTCPMNGRLQLSSGAIVTDPDRCIGCRTCIYACPFGAPVVNPETGKVMSCDLCAGDELGPWCVMACEIQGALKYVDARKAGKGRSRESAGRFKKILGRPFAG